MATKKTKKAPAKKQVKKAVAKKPAKKATAKKTVKKIAAKKIVARKLVTNWFPLFPNPLPFSTHVIDFESLNGSSNNAILIKLKSNCSITHHFDIDTNYIWLKITGLGLNKTFQFFTSDSLNEPDYSSTSFSIAAPTGKKTVFRVTNNNRGATNTVKWIGSDNTRNDYNGISTGIEFRDIKNEYIGFKKDTATNKLFFKWNHTTSVSFVPYSFNKKSDCEAITLNTIYGPTYPCLGTACAV